MKPRPYAEACDRNRGPILAVLEQAFAECSRVVEIGSGTGQHAAWFAPRLRHLSWIATDLPERLEGMGAWLRDVDGGRIEGPLALDVRFAWPELGRVDGAFSANTAHIMPASAVEAMFHGLGDRLESGAPFCLYGPFIQSGDYGGDSNRVFDQELRRQEPSMGLRDVVWLDDVAAASGFVLERAYPMPANNQTLLWRRG